MAELKRNLINGTMNIDLDPRIVPPGSYRIAENINVSRSEGADVGAAENVRGNQRVSSDITLPSSYVTVGSVKDDLNDKVYWFFTGLATEGIFELDISIDETQPEFITNPLNPLLVDIPNPEFRVARNQVNRILEFSTNRNIFNFDANNLITGANIIGNLLYWTDGFNPPRKVNIERFRGSGNFYTISPGGLSGRDVTELLDDGTTFVSETTSSDTVGAVFYTDYDPQYESEARDSEPLVVFGTDENSQPAFPGDLISVAKRPPLFAPLVTSPGDLSGEDGDNPSPFSSPGDFLYDNYVYFAYRYKYRDGETTPLSPFSNPAFFPQDFDLQRDPSTLRSMVNRFRRVEVQYDVGNEEVAEVELVVTSARDLTLKSLVTLNKSDNNITSSTPSRCSFETFIYDNNKVYSTISGDQITRIYDDVPLKAKAQEIIGNRLVYGNYTQNYNLRINNDEGAPLVPDFLVDYRSVPRTAGDLTAACTVKSDRDYQVGVVYLDAEGRQTPVLLSNERVNDEGEVVATSSVRVPFNDQLKSGVTHQNRNILNITIASAAPWWATHFRFFIKQTQGDFYNVYPKNAIRNTHQNSSRIYLQLDGAERNKISVNTVLTLKGTDAGIENTRYQFRVDPYIQGATEAESAFTLAQSPDGSFTFDQDIRGLVQFNVPFDIAQSSTGNGFAQTEAMDADQVFPGPGKIFELDENGDDLEGFSIVSVILSDEGEDDRTLVLNNDYSLDTETQTVTLNPDTPFSVTASVTVLYSYQDTATDDPAASDYYVAVVPIVESDLNASGIADHRVSDLATIWETVPQIDSVADIYFEHGTTYRCINGAHTDSRVEGVGRGARVQSLYRENDLVDEVAIIEGDSRIGTPVEGNDGSVQVELDYFNCFSYTNGIEETKVFGRFNEPALLPGIKASTINEAYRQRNQESWLIHSGVFNDDVNLNRLNEFNVGGQITTELDIAEGSIQKIHSRNTNLIVFQEDKVKNIPINKNLIQTAGGNGSLTTDSRFFGTESAYSGEYGISTNPESFATYGSRIYFADKNRGALCRLSQNGIEEVSRNGLEAYTRTHIANAAVIVGLYDDYHDQMHWSFRNRINNPLRSPNLILIDMSTEGRPDPRSECNRNEDLIRFQRFFAFIASSDIGLQVGDVIFVDRLQSTFFNGEYRWYRLQDELGTEPDVYDRVIQVSPYGVITGVVERQVDPSDPDEFIGGCALQYPPDLNRESFDISKVGFQNEFDACGNGIIDDRAFFVSETVDQVNPINGSQIFEDRDTTTQSSRTGWYLSSFGQEKWVLKIVNGLVDLRLRCSAISAGRRALLGSNEITII